MADQTIYEIPDLVTSDDGNAFTLTIQNSMIQHVDTVYIEIASGTWTFSNRNSTVGSSATWTTGDKIPITIQNHTLYCKAANGSETFKISS